MSSEDCPTKTLGQERPGPAMKLVGGCPIQARFWLEWGCSDLPRWVPHSKFRVLCEI